ncbi:MAG: hypothetical protein AAB539_00655 [Patescibacteria group bacterium]
MEAILNNDGDEIDNEQSDTDQRYEDQQLSLDEKQRSDDALSESKYLLGERYDIFYSSFVIALFSYLEHKMNRLCRKWCAKNAVKINLEDIRGSGIHRARIYLEKACNKVMPNEELWNEVVAIGLVRNCLAHAGGELGTNNKKLRNYIAKSSKNGIRIYNDNLRLSKEYCSFALGIMHKFLHELTRPIF